MAWVRRFFAYLERKEMVMACKFLKNNKDNVMCDFTHAKKKVVKVVSRKELKMPFIYAFADNNNLKKKEGC